MGREGCHKGILNTTRISGFRYNVFSQRQTNSTVHENDQFIRGEGGGVPGWGCTSCTLLSAPMASHPYSHRQAAHGVFPKGKLQRNYGVGGWGASQALYRWEGWGLSKGSNAGRGDGETKSFNHILVFTYT